LRILYDLDNRSNVVVEEHRCVAQPLTSRNDMRLQLLNPRPSEVDNVAWVVNATVFETWHALRPVKTQRPTTATCQGQLYHVPPPSPYILALRLPVAMLKWPSSPPPHAFEARIDEDASTWFTRLAKALCTVDAEGMVGFVEIDLAQV